MNVEKRAIRQRLRAQRRALPTGTVKAAGRAVQAQLRAFRPYRAAASVIAYIADENEVPTEGLLEEAAGLGRSLYLPWSGTPVGVVPWQLHAPLKVGHGRVSEPAEGTPTRPELPAVAFVPVVGWDVHGCRLGRGGGFYDRLFAELTTGITRVGLAYEFQECAELPRDPWDVSLDYVITERRIVQCGCVVEPSVQKGGLQLS
jgi:5-formyltetrahydrofolate cyclo-ligase